MVVVVVCKWANCPSANLAMELASHDLLSFICHVSVGLSFFAYAVKETIMKI